MAIPKYRYGELTWPEVKAVAEEGRVAIVPIATLEDHGHHLPIDTDLRLCTAVCEAAAARAPDRIVLVPAINHGYSPHHLDFPGPITIGAHTLIDYGVDVCRSLAHHGFGKILIVNGHGSNTPFIDIIARLAVVETEALAAAVNYWAAPGVREVAESLRESDKIGGMNHACEFETSLYLALAPELVDMDQAVRELSHHPTKNYWGDLIGGDGPLVMMEYWSALSETGVMGDPTKANAEKGRALFDAAANGIVELVDEMRARRPAVRRNHH
ncbi:MAG: creatininase family protein [Candidatus Eremiobacteraeota bacterium]|nr:creatininase family protein [Candidatus Eremiobacteraeota bacterium]